MKWITTWVFILSAYGVHARDDAHKFFKQQPQHKDFCFQLLNLKTGKLVHNVNPKRCKTRFAPCSTFKAALSVMAVDSGYFQSSDQTIPWDGKLNWMKSHNQDQTPETFMGRSVIWVSRLIVHHLGKDKVQQYLNRFNYGNKKIQGDLNSFWLSKGSVKISAQEQIKFLRNIWLNQFKWPRKKIDLIKELMFIEKTQNSRLYGKTGTGCIDPNCMAKGGRQLGWFVGALEHHNDNFVFAANYSDLAPSKGYAGPKARKAIEKFIQQFYP